MSSKASGRLQKVIRDRHVIVVPGVFDGLSGKLAESAGFPAVFLSSVSAAASLVAIPDSNVLSMKELVDKAAALTMAVSIPVIAEAPGGFGNPVNVTRAVQEFERARISAIQFDDQALPRQHPETGRKTVVSLDEMVAKIQAAVSVRSNPDFMVIARTDSLSLEGFQGMVDRIQAYEAAGADAIYVEDIINTAQMVRIREEVNVPLVYSISQDGKSPVLTVEQVETLGFQIILFGSQALQAAAWAQRQMWEELKMKGSLSGFASRQIRGAAWEELFYRSH